MGKIKKLLGFTAIMGAAIGGAAYYKKKYGMTVTNDDDFEDDLNVDIKSKKVIDISTEGSDTDSKKVTITFNKDKAKKVVNDTLDDIGDAMYLAKDKITNTIGEENIEDAKEAASKVKNKIVDTIGEENISKAKSTLNTVADKTKEKAGEIFTEENMDLAKDKVADALDKTKDVLKKASDKVKSLKNDNEEAIEDFDIDVLDELDDLDELDSLDKDAVPNEEVSDNSSEPEITTEDVTKVHSVANNETPVKKDEDISRYDFLADEVEDL